MTADTTQSELIEKGRAALPAEYRIPDRTPTLDEARACCQGLSEMHDEVSWLLRGLSSKLPGRSAA